jgi:hypothetical protein
MHLLNALKVAGLPSTYKTLLKMERDGVISRGGNDAEAVGNRDRFYSEQEIKDIVVKVKAHKNERK